MAGMAFGAVDDFGVEAVRYDGNRIGLGQCLDIIEYRVDPLVDEAAGTGMDGNEPVGWIGVGHVTIFTLEQVR